MKIIITKGLNLKKNTHVTFGSFLKTNLKRIREIKKKTKLIGKTFD